MNDDLIGGWLELLAAIVRQAALDWEQLRAADAYAFLDAAGLVQRAPSIRAAWTRHQAVAGAPGRRREVQHAA